MTALAILLLAHVVLALCAGGVFGIVCLIAWFSEAWQDRLMGLGFTFLSLCAIVFLEWVVYGCISHYLC